MATLCHTPMQVHNIITTYLASTTSVATLSIHHDSIFCPSTLVPMKAIRKAISEEWGHQNVDIYKKEDDHLSSPLDNNAQILDGEALIIQPGEFHGQANAKWATKGS
jgi:hypothetical protein